MRLSCSFVAVQMSATATSRLAASSAIIWLKSAGALVVGRIGRPADPWHSARHNNGVAAGHAVEQRAVHLAELVGR